jgi:hypothetical protein
MATSTLGTNANNTLTSLINSGAMVAADLAAIANAVKDDLVNGHPIWPGAYAQNGLLFVPNRGVLKVLPGDFVGVDAQGWPILVSANSIANGGGWTHT